MICSQVLCSCRQSGGWSVTLRYVCSPENAEPSLASFADFLTAYPLVCSFSITPWHDGGFHHPMHQAIFGLHLYLRPIAPNRERTSACGQTEPPQQLRTRLHCQLARHNRYRPKHKLLTWASGRGIHKQGGLCTLKDHHD